MSDNQNRVQLQIMGELFTVKSELPRQDVLKASVFLNEQVDALQKRNPNLSPKHLAILVAFNMCEQLLRAKKEYEDLATILDNK